jgi:hypothetical protein
MSDILGNMNLGVNTIIYTFLIKGMKYDEAVEEWEFDSSNTQDLRVEGFSPDGFQMGSMTIGGYEVGTDGYKKFFSMASQGNEINFSIFSNTACYNKFQALFFKPTKGGIDNNQFIFENGGKQYNFHKGISLEIIYRSLNRKETYTTGQFTQITPSGSHDMNGLGNISFTFVSTGKPILTQL